MASYIMLLNYTDQGIRTIKQSPMRADEAHKLAKSCGAEMKAVYMTLGAHDLVAILEAPNDEAMARFALAAAALGNVRSTTLKAFSETEYRKIIESLP